MANVGLAAQLAKQAAQAAREEMAAAHGAEVGSSAPKAPAAWTVPVLPHTFGLDDAMQRATLKVTSHYQTVLAPQGLEVALQAVNEAPDAGTDVAAMRQPEPQLQAHLREQQSGRLVKAYTAPALLALFATQQQATGVVVDGQV